MTRHRPSVVSLRNNPKLSFRESVDTRYMQGACVVTDQFIYTKYRNDGEMLYDLRTDPGENRKVAADPQHAETLAKMKTMLAASEAEAGQAKP